MPRASTRRRPRSRTVRTYIVASGASGHLGQVYGGPTCGLTCPQATTGTAVRVTLGATTSGIDFALVSAGAVTGSVTAAASGQPVSAQVTLFSASGDTIWTGQSDAAGIFRTTVALPTGTYYLKAAGASGYLAQLYRGVNCGASCPPLASATPVSVTQASTTSGIDFPLVRGGSIAGTVTAGDTGTPLVHVRVRVFDVSGRDVWIGFTDDAGAYATTTPLVGAAYHVQADATSTYLGQLYPGMNCGLTCPSPGAAGAYSWPSRKPRRPPTSRWRRAAQSLAR